MKGEGVQNQEALTLKASRAKVKTSALQVHVVVVEAISYQSLAAVTLYSHFSVSR